MLWLSRLKNKIYVCIKVTVLQRANVLLETLAMEDFLQTQMDTARRIVQNHIMEFGIVARGMITEKEIL